MLKSAMRIDLYPADHETDNPKQDFIDLLRQSGSSLDVVAPGSPAVTLSVAGDLALVARRIQEWLAQRPGRSAAPPSVCEPSLVGKDSTVIIQVHRSLKTLPDGSTS